MKVSSCFKVGYVLKPHGLKGEVTLSLDPDFPEQTPTTVLLEKDHQLVPYFIERISLRGKKALVKFEDVDTIEEARSVSRCLVYLPKKVRPRLATGEFYDDELVGFEVSDMHAGALGTVQSITSAGPNKLLSVDYHGKEVLIPINGPFITGVKKSKKLVTVHLPDGFLDL